MMRQPGNSRVVISCVMASPSPQCPHLATPASRHLHDLVHRWPSRKRLQKPNIVFLLMDNLGYGEVGCYGGGVTRGAPTPRIDKLATEGTRLTNFNVEAQCSPSRSAIMTGRFSIRSGTHSVPIGGGRDGLTQWEVTIADTLSAAGYATAHFGKWHLGSEQGRLPNDQGFDEWYGIPRTTDEALWPGDPAAKASGVRSGTPDPYKPSTK